MLLRISVLILCAGLCVGADGPKEKAKEVNDDEIKIQGDWSCIALSIDGTPAPEGIAKKMKVNVSNGKLVAKPVIGLRKSKVEVEDRPTVRVNTFYAREGEEKTTYQLAPGKNPKEIDLTSLDDKELVAKGIYQLDGDELKFCISPDEKRPTELVSKEDSGIRLMVLKRVK